MPFSKEKLMDKIKQGGLAIKPRWVFLLKTFLFVSISAVVAILSLFVFGAIVFLIFGFGIVSFRDMITFGMVIKALPWVLILVMITFVFIMLSCLGHVMPLYRKSKSSILIILALVFISIGVIINNTKAFKHIYESRPLINNLMNREYKRGLFRFVKLGNVIETKENGIILVQLEDGSIISTDKLERKSPGSKKVFDFKKGDRVWVSIKECDQGIKIFRIRPYNFENEIKPCPGCNNKYKGRKAIPYNKF